MTTIAELTRAILADRIFPGLRNHVVNATGLEYYAGRANSFAEQIAHRITDLGVPDCGNYLELLHDGNAGEAELDRLIVRLTIGETHFFRHRELFDALRDVALPEIVERNRASKRLRIWSAGCSTGAEAYSLSILLRREMRFSFDDWNISIVGTDINRPVLSQATAGEYEDWAFRGTTPEFRRDCFDEVVTGKSWRIAPIFQQGVTFHYHNLVRHPFPSLAYNLIAFDIILCRNVLIYFASEVAQRTISQLAECLVPGGWLALGHAENGGHSCEKFDTVNLRGATLHRKSLSAPCLDALARAKCQPPRLNSRRGHSANGQAVALSRVMTSPHCHGFTLTKQRCKTQTSSMSSAIERVRTLADQGDVEGALQLCLSLIFKEPLNAVLYFYSGLLFDQAGRHTAAADALSRAIYLDREFVLAHYYLGIVQQKLANVPAASKSFRNVMQLLEGLEQTASLPNAGGLNVADLNELTRMHIETLKAV
jgi:chemotaxis protein methyltransferase CheR